MNARVSVPLFQGQFDAVLSWTYNLGEGALKSSTLAFPYRGFSQATQGIPADTS